MFKKTQGKLYYGWIIVFIAALGNFFSGPGQTYSTSAFIDQYIQDFEWSRSLVSSVYSGATLAAGLLMMIVGRFIDRLGQRIMMVTVGILFATALFFNSLVMNIGMLAVGFFLVRLLGQGSMNLIPGTLVAQWFVKKRGRAFSFLSLGGFASAMLFPIISTALIESFGWQFAWRFWGVAVLVIFVPIAYLGVRNRPEDVGLLPDGQVTENEDQKDSKLGILIPEIAEVDWTLAEARETRTFWLVLICMAIPAMINTGITFHLFSIFESNGLAPGAAALVLSLMAVVGIPMTFISGFITEKMPTNYLLVVSFSIQAALLLLLLITNSYGMAILFGVMWGTAGGLERISFGVIWPNYFGRKYLGAISGVGATAGVIASSVGPIPLGFGYDMTGSYHTVITMLIIFPIIGFFAALFAKKPVKAENA